MISFMVFSSLKTGMTIERVSNECSSVISTPCMNYSLNYVSAKPDRDISIKTFIGQTLNFTDNLQVFGRTVDEAAGRRRQPLVHRSGAVSLYVHGDVKKAVLLEPRVDRLGDLRLEEARDLVRPHFDARHRVVDAHPELPEAEPPQHLLARFHAPPRLLVDRRSVRETRGETGERSPVRRREIEDSAQSADRGLGQSILEQRAADGQLLRCA